MKNLINHVKKERGADNVLLLDSGIHGKGRALPSKRVVKRSSKAQNYLGVDVMVGHWEFTYGKKRVKELIEMLNAKFHFSKYRW